MVCVCEEREKTAMCTPSLLRSQRSQVIVFAHFYTTIYQKWTSQILVSLAFLLYTKKKSHLMSSGMSSKHHVSRLPFLSDHMRKWSVILHMLQDICPLINCYNCPCMWPDLRKHNFFLLWACTHYFNIGNINGCITKCYSSLMVQWYRYSCLPNL